MWTGRCRGKSKVSVVYLSGSLQKKLWTMMEWLPWKTEKSKVLAGHIQDNYQSAIHSETRSSQQWRYWRSRGFCWIWSRTIAEIDVYVCGLSIHINYLEQRTNTESQESLPWRSPTPTSLNVLRKRLRSCAPSNYQGRQKEPKHDNETIIREEDRFKGYLENIDVNWKTYGKITF